ncbi:GrpB family protein [Candidatus Enterococcus mansonii]|uniref:Glutamate-rich protein GrpB n=1 Tax=Candidatus Enterococcus mansonii TaxID=1834181 RepID=A0A242CGK1_9ENTE|nr:GrpB family protein [Enterococcus sp. 4G2_DIV0659]OTO09341.1 hypothetical protein A5880_000020 [Enterococcus sp. 4G2_DIV0659]
MERKVEVVGAKKEWKDQFKQMKEQLDAVFTDELIAIHHIGSTAIEGIYAKPILDILVVVNDIEKVAHYQPAMQRLGYECLGENGISKRRFFIKGATYRSHHVHVFQKGNPEIERHLNFRDYLNHHSKEAQEYSQLKVKLAKKFPYDIQSYIEGKDAFIKEIDRKSISWKREDL